MVQYLGTGNYRRDASCVVFLSYPNDHQALSGRGYVSVAV